MNQKRMKKKALNLIATVMVLFLTLVGLNTTTLFADGGGVQQNITMCSLR